MPPAGRNPQRRAGFSVSSVICGQGNARHLAGGACTLLNRPIRQRVCNPLPQNELGFGCWSLPEDYCSGRQQSGGRPFGRRSADCVVEVVVTPPAASSVRTRDRPARHRSSECIPTLVAATDRGAYRSAPFGVPAMIVATCAACPLRVRRAETWNRPPRAVGRESHGIYGPVRFSLGVSSDESVGCSIFVPHSGHTPDTLPVRS